VSGVSEDVLPSISKFFCGGGWRLREWAGDAGSGAPGDCPGAVVRDLSGTALWNSNIRLELPLAGAKVNTLYGKSAAELCSPAFHHDLADGKEKRRFQMVISRDVIS
jgi:hypothetical protein